MQITTLLAGLAAVAVSCLSANAAPSHTAKNATILSRARRNLAQENINPIDGMSTVVLSIFGLEGNPVKNLKINIMDMETGRAYDTKTTDSRGDIFIFATEKRSAESTKSETFKPSRTEPNKLFGIMWDYLPGKVVRDSKMYVDEFFTEVNRVRYYKFFVDRVKVGVLPEAGMVQIPVYLQSWWTDPVPIHEGRMAAVGWTENFPKARGVIEARLFDENNFPIAHSRMMGKDLFGTHHYPATDVTGTSFHVNRINMDRRTYDMWFEQPLGRFEGNNKMRAHRFKDKWVVYNYKITRVGEPVASVPQPAFVEGIVVDANGNTVANHKLTVRADDGLVVALLFSDNNGKVNLHLLSGSYYIHPIDKQTDPENEGFSIKVTLAAGVRRDTITIPNFIKSETSTDNTDNSDNSVSTAPTEYLILNKEGNPAHDVDITLKNGMGQTVYVGTTDENGMFLVLIPKGKYTGTWNVGNDSGSFNFDVTGQTSAISTTIPPTVGQEFNFRDSAGVPLEDMEVEVKDGDGVVVYTGKTNENGHFSLNLLAGEYTAHPKYPEGIAPVDGGVINADLRGSGSGEVTEITIPLAIGDVNTVETAKPEGSGLNLIARIHGFIYLDKVNNSVLDAGEELAGIRVTLTDVTTLISKAVLTSSAGEYVFDNLPRATYNVSFERTSIPGYAAGAPIVKTIEIGDMSQVKFDFRLQVPVVVTTCNITGLLYVDANKNRLRDPTEQPQAGGVVSLVSEDKSVSLAETSGVDGRVAFFNVPHGRYFLKLDLSAVPEFSGSQIAQWVTINRSKINLGFSLQRL